MTSRGKHIAGRYLRKRLAKLSIFSLFMLTAYMGLGLPGSMQVDAFEIRVRAQSQLTVDVNAAGTHLQIYGQLRDDLQQILPQREVVIHVTPASAAGVNARGKSVNMTYTRLTDRRGQFELNQELPPDFYHIAVEFLETEHLEPSVSLHDVEIKSHPVELSIRAAAYVRGDASAVLFSAHARVLQTGVSGILMLESSNNMLEHIQLDRFGRGTIDVREALAPGFNTLHATLPATDFREAVQKSLRIRRGDHLKLNGQATRVLERLQRGVSVTGNVQDEFGKIEDLQVRVTLIRGDLSESEGDDSSRVIVRTVQSNADGNFHAFVPHSELADGSWSIDVEAIPDVGSVFKRNLDTIVLDRSVSKRVLQWSAKLVGLAFLLFVAQRLFMGLKRRIRAHKKASEARDALQQSLHANETVQVGALDDSTVQLEPADTTKDPADRPATHVIAGITWDPWQGKPVPHAVLTFTASQESRTVESDGEGRFYVDDLSPDSYHLLVKAHGFVSAEMAFDVPHDGRLSRFRLELVAVPVKIRQAYQATIRAFDAQDRWGEMTPRQMNVMMERIFELDPNVHEYLLTVGEDPAELFRKITEIVEESYFSGRQYDEAIWHITRELASVLTSLNPAANKGSFIR